METDVDEARKELERQIMGDTDEPDEPVARRGGCRVTFKAPDAEPLDGVWTYDLPITASKAMDAALFAAAARSGRAPESLEPDVARFASAIGYVQASVTSAPPWALRADGKIDWLRIPVQVVVALGEVISQHEQRFRDGCTTQTSAT